MCGIAGFASDRTGGVPTSALRDAVRLLEHRGPDDYGFYSRRGGKSYLGRDFNRQLSEADLLLVHRRLSILDLSDAGRQPLASPCGRYFIVYNAEIYNYLELRGQLEKLGHRFRSRCDTEVLLAAYVEWGPDALPKLVGMFAFAVYDVQENSLFLARDCFGVKPLFFARTSRGFGFASEIKALLKCMDIRAVANAERVYSFLRFGMSDYGEDTMFRTIRQLEPAHWMRVRLDSLQCEAPVRYWRLPEQRTVEASFEEAVAHVREMFLENVSLHLRSDVPVGAALSGGVDSSAIVAAMRRAGGANLNLKTFSFIPDDPKISEERWIDEVNGAAGAEAHYVRPSGETLSDDLHQLTQLHDEPIGGIAPIPQNHVFRAARAAGVKVMLDGQGADEILGGYRLFLGARLGSLLRQGQFQQAAKFYSACSRLPGCGRSTMLQLTLECLLPARLQSPLRKLVGRELNPPWLNRRWLRDECVAPFVQTYTNRRDVLHAQLCRAVTNGLPRLLRFEDRNSMCYSIESRVPFLTPKFVEYVMSLPEEYVISNGGETKSVFKEAMRGVVPAAVLDRRDKAGFPTPDVQWLALVGGWVDRTLASAEAGAIPALNLPAIRSQWAAIRTLKRPFNMSIWRSLGVITWSRNFEVQFT